jgi:DNA repair exonuclease SbcCD ATPase subunit
MASAAAKLQQGDTQAALSELGQAGEMLSEMEQLEQALNELDAQMAQMDDLRDDLNEGDSPNRGKCKQCSGSGFRADGSPCPWCNGTGR